MRLIPGVIFSAETPDHEQLRARLQVSAGTRRANALAAEAGSYRDWSIVPNRPWRTPTDQELALLTHGSTEESPDIHLLRIPAELLRAWREAVGETVRGTYCRNLATTLKTLAGEFVGDLADFVTGFGELMKGPLIRVNPPGLLTVTTDGEDVRIGLHVDNWHDYPPEARERSPNRICFNMSEDPRFLLLLNVRMSDMPALICGGEAGIRPEWIGTPMGLAFMQTFPQYPVLKLRIEPGEAYMAPTENLVHDANTEGMRFPDVAIHALGKFSLPIVVAEGEA